jgi:hypothetical protein
MSCETALIIKITGENAVDCGDGLSFTLRGRDVRNLPEPVVYIDGAVAEKESYTFDPGDSETSAAIAFEDQQTGKKVTCDYYWKLSCGPENDLTVYEFSREANTRVMKDVNGRTMVVESCVKVTGWRGMLVWDYADQSFWDEIRRMAESPGATFDLERTSLVEPLDKIANLYPTGYPQFSEIPGVPGRTQIKLTVVQLG